MKITSNDKDVQNILRKIEDAVDLNRNQVAEYFRIESGKWNQNHLDALIDEVVDPVKYGSELLDMKTNSIKSHTTIDFITVSAILQYEVLKEGSKRFRNRQQV